MPRKLTIATRESPLALWQAEFVRTTLRQAHPGLDVQLLGMTSRGDQLLDSPLAKLGGKGLFVKELEEALLDGSADIAVHSMKDVPMEFPPGLCLGVICEREDPSDAFVSNRFPSLDALPTGSVVGTSSLRRRAQILYRRPDLEVVEFRGNVQTRLKKLDDGVADCTFLAMAGLNRLGMEHVANGPVAHAEMLPAVAQGAIGIERREADPAVKDLLSPIHDFPTGYRLDAERAFLRALDGSCQMPIAGLAELGDRQIRLRGEILRPDGSECLHHELSGPIDDAAAIGAELARVLLEDAGPYFFD